MKNFLMHVGVTILFVLVAAIFFKPAVFEDMQLQAGDSEKVIGMNKELRDYQDQTGEGITWTGSMFSGMPSYTISTPDGPSNYLFDVGLKVLWFLNSTDAGLIFASLFGMYLFLVVMGYGIGISAFGAIAFAMSSYFIIILPAGHVCKAWAMSYIPFVLLGMLLLTKKKWIWGTIVFAASLSLELRSNHIQITYYLAIFCLFLFVAFVVDMLRKKEVKSLLVAVGLMAVSAVAALVTNADRMYANLEMAEVSTRGPSRLSAAADGKSDKSTGLDRDYAFSWSYGAGEMTTLLVPNAYGGASGEELGPESNTVKTLQEKGYRVDTIQMPTYWGTQPFTSGPVYLGAIVCFLAIFSLFVVDNKYKWYIVLASLFFGVLALGRNLPGINNFLFDNLPMYNKFRTPSMALVMLQVTFALLGCLALKRVAAGDYDEKEMQKYLYISAGIVGGLCLLMWIAPSTFFTPGFWYGLDLLALAALVGLFIYKLVKKQITDNMQYAYYGLGAVCFILLGIIIKKIPDNFEPFISGSDASYAQQIGLDPNLFVSMLTADRATLASSDAFRSLIFIVLAAAILWFVIKKQHRNLVQYAMCAIAVLTLVDLWGVDRRYCNDKNYVEKTAYNPYQETPADTEILKDKDPSYRVLTFDNPFNDTHIPYFHKSIGGYNAAKLRDYQDLVDMQIDGEMQYFAANFNKMHDSVFDAMPVLNMLNTRYMVFNQGQNSIRNNRAMGNAWFVQNYQVTKPGKVVKKTESGQDTTINCTAVDMDLYLLDSVNIAKTALIEPDSKAAVEGKQFAYDSTATITLTSYKPNELVYKSNSKTPGLAVFSEIYYPRAWSATIDGKPVDHFRADWLLRSMLVPAGQHTIVFTNYASTYWTLRNLASISSLVLLILLIALIGYACFKSYKEGKDNTAKATATKK